MKISIAMATYNGERFIREQLNSLAAQTRLPDELVVVDDGSVDRTLEILEQFKQKAAFAVRIFRNEENVGYADTFMHAASLCVSDLVAFCDQDDIWLPGKLQCAVAPLEDSAIVLTIHSCRMVTETLNPMLRPGLWVTRDEVKPAMGVPPVRGSDIEVYGGFNLTIRRSLMEKVLCVWPWGIARETGIPHVLGHDEVVYQLARAEGSVAYIKQALVLYRQHSGNAASTGAMPLRGHIRLIQHANRDAYNRQAVFYFEKANAWLRIANAGNATASPLATAIAERCATKAEKLRRRADLYDEDKTFRVRLACLTRMIFAGCYGAGFERLSLRSLIKDLVAVSARRLFG